VDQEISKRISEGDIHPTGALWGKGDCGQGGLTLLIEQSIIAQYAPLGDGLIKAGLEADRRSLRCFPEMLSWDFSPESHLKMSFRLTAGSYATALIREILKTQV
jgi:tRNA pseudouridine13 synthase